MRTEYIFSTPGLSWTIEPLRGPGFLKLSAATGVDCDGFEMEKQRSLLLMVPTPDFSSERTFVVFGRELEKAAEMGDFDCVQSVIRSCPELATKTWIQKIELSIGDEGRTFEQRTTFGAKALVVAILHEHWDIANYLSEVTGIKLDRAVEAVATANKHLE